MKALYAGRNDDGKRFDRIVRALLPHVSLGAIYGAIRRGDVRLNGRRVALNRRIVSGDRIEWRATIAPPVTEPAARESGADEANSTMVPPAGAEWVVYRNAHILAIAKPIGIATSGPDSCNAMLGEWLRGSIDSGLVFRPAALHQLDRNSSGLLLFGTSIEGARRFSLLLATRQVEKHYLALVEGRITRRQTWNEPLARDSVRRQSYADATGKPAMTLVTPIAARSAHTLCLCSMRSGRTHQIRAHAGLHGHPLVGDAKYGAVRTRAGYLLHAWRLELAQADDLLGFHYLHAPLPRLSYMRLVALFGLSALHASPLHRMNGSHEHNDHLRR